MPKIVTKMKLLDETKGALIYGAIDKDGRDLEMRDTAVSKIYVRKDHIDGKPPYLEFTLDSLV